MLAASASRIRSFSLIAHFPIIDEKRQLVFATFDFMRRGNVDGWTYQRHRFVMPERMRMPNKILNTERFKFVDGKIGRPMK